MVIGAQPAALRLRRTVQQQAQHSYQPLVHRKFQQLSQRPVAVRIQVMSFSFSTKITTQAIQLLSLASG